MSSAVVQCSDLVGGPLAQWPAEPAISVAQCNVLQVGIAAADGGVRLSEGLVHGPCPPCSVDVISSCDM